MVAVLTQSRAIVNLNKITTISAVKDENDLIAVVADQTYILGYYNTEVDATIVINWIASAIGSQSESANICITMPLSNEVGQNAEDD